MLRIVTLLVFCISLSISLLGCQRAQRYRTAVASKGDKERVSELRAHWAWMDTDARGTPIVFVPASSKEWTDLPEFWNQVPSHPVLGEPTIHLGQDPLNLLAAMAAATANKGVKIKVPLGLPDPTQHIPEANPPTVEKWKLGKDLFFAKLLVGQLNYACADCHHPATGFADTFATYSRAERNTLSLINCVYNMRQFWDGRVGALEEVILGSLENERPGDKGAEPPEETHIWASLSKALRGNEDYVLRFKQVFGVEVPTHDAIAKALASYMRTILSGDSLYDRMEAERLKKGSPPADALPFRQFLGEAALKALGEPPDRAAEAANRLETGHGLFFGKAGCYRCHSGPLFRDGDFHNIGLASLRDDPGRLAHVSPGLKENRLNGAFRTPTLRALPRTAPYFHDGGKKTLEHVIGYYNNGVYESPYLAKALRDPADPAMARLLELTEQEVKDLALFLRS